MRVTIDDRPNAMVIISADNVRVGEPRWYSPSREQAALDIAEKNVGADLHTMTREECGIDDDSCPVAVVCRPLTDGSAPSLADVGAAVDTGAILAAMGVEADAGNTRVHVLPCDGDYVVNVVAAGVVTEARARRMIAARTPVGPQSVVEAIQEACGDGSPVGFRST